MTTFDNAVCVCVYVYVCVEDKEEEEEDEGVNDCSGLSQSLQIKRC